MVGRPNSSDSTVSERDYEQKFNRRPQPQVDQNAIKQKEAAGDESWRATKAKASRGFRQKDRQRTGFRFLRPGRFRRGSAFLFIIGFVLAGVWYTSVLAPNILLVNVKEMYTNDLADATTALDIYTQLMYSFKIGPGVSGQDCDSGIKDMQQQSIKCKLTTMSRSQKKIFEKQGWIVLANKVYEDDRDDNDKTNDKPESRFIVGGLLPPAYTDTVKRAAEMGINKLEDILRNPSQIQQSLSSLSRGQNGGNGSTGNEAAQVGLVNEAGQALTSASDALNSLLGSQLPSGAIEKITGMAKLQNDPKYAAEAMFNVLMQAQPIIYGPQLWMYSQLSTTAKQQVWGVFNPRSSFFHDARFRERLKTRYNMSTSGMVGGSDYCAVNESFDNAVRRSDGGIDPFTGQPNPTNGISLASLSGGIANITTGLSAIFCDLTKDVPLPSLDSSTLFKNIGLDGLLSAPVKANSWRPDSNKLIDSNYLDLTNSTGLDKSFAKPNLDLSSALGLGTLVGGRLSNVAGDAEGILSSLKQLYIPNNFTELADKLPFVGDLEVAGNLVATNSHSYTSLMCSWYTIGHLTNNALTRAKATSAARYALQYLKAADAIKGGGSNVVGVNTLSSKLAQDSFNIVSPNPTATNFGSSQGLSATDSIIYKLIAYGSPFGGALSFGQGGDISAALNGLLGSGLGVASNVKSIMLYNLAGYENSLFLAPSWSQLLANAAGLKGVTGADGQLLPAGFSVGGEDKKYCESGEKTINRVSLKGLFEEDTKCDEAIAAMVPAIISAASGAISEVAKKSCPQNVSKEDLVKYLLSMGTTDPPKGIENWMLPSQKLVQLAGTPYYAGWFGINAMIAAGFTQLLYSSQVTGLDANYALFSGMGELLGDMAMSRGLMPSDPGSMMGYLMLGELLSAQSGYDNIAKAQAKQNPFDPYNRFSFVGSLVRGMAPKSNGTSPLFGAIENVFSVFGSSLRRASSGNSAKAFYQSQPNFLTLDGGGGRLAAYIARLSSCPFDLQQISIGIFPDIMCNVRYSMPITDVATAINLGGVIDYMTNPQSDAYKNQLDELDRRILETTNPDLTDLDKGDLANLTTRRLLVSSVSQQPFIDKKTGKPTPGSEYEKYLQYCVNRLDPWGHSAVGMRYQELPPDTKKQRATKYDDNLEPIGKTLGDPNQKTFGWFPEMAVTSTQSDLDWYTGKKCASVSGTLDKMVQYFRVFTMLCSVDGSMSGIVDCTEPDSGSESAYTNPFYLNNDVLFSSFY